jgi:putative ubiquitin-RnfH superfamily antitoxin RatB of RatAB toxin-antitoxin module
MALSQELTWYTSLNLQIVNRMAEEKMTVEVAYAMPDSQLILTVEVPYGVTAATAITASGVLLKFPEINLDVNKIGIFGKLKDLSTVLNPMDRVEIYRPLIADPKKARRERASKRAR